MSSLSGTALADYGAEVFKRDRFTCVYCGFDGRPFDNWMQLSLEHIFPKSSGGNDALDNLVTACRTCNSITSRMKFSEEASKEHILREKKERVTRRRKEFHRWWLNNVAPTYMERPVPLDC